MSSPLHPRSLALPRVAKLAAFALALPLVACGDDEGGGSGTGSGGSDGVTATSASTILGSTSASATSGEGGADAGDATTTTTGEGDDASSATGSGASDAGGGGDAGGGAPVEPCPDFASEVVDVAYGPGAGFGQAGFPDIVFGGPRGSGDLSGSLDVLSLGNGGSITLGFADRRIVDGEGPDFIVFENAFWAGGDPQHAFAELATVEVSADGETWETFPCAALEAPYGSCAGWHPVYANVDDNEIDPLDPASAGGDAFDLADVGLAEARYVRIVDREDQNGFAGAFDLDAVAIVHGACDDAR